MKATFNQAGHLIQLAIDKGLTMESHQILSNTALLSDLFEAAVMKGNDLTKVNRGAYRKLIGLPPIIPQVVPVEVEYVLNTDASPRIPSGYNLTGKGAKHKGMGKVRFEKRADGQLYLNGRKAVRHLSLNQKDGKVIQGHKLRKELEDENRPLLNATVRDYLIAHPELIPEDWKTGVTYFWDTVFCDADGDLLVRYLYWDGDRWRWYIYWLDNDWNDNEPAASLEQVNAEAL